MTSYLPSYPFSWISQISPTPERLFTSKVLKPCSNHLESFNNQFQRFWFNWCSLSMGSFESSPGDSCVQPGLRISAPTQQSLSISHSYALSLCFEYCSHTWQTSSHPIKLSQMKPCPRRSGLAIVRSQNSSCSPFMELTGTIYLSCQPTHCWI